MRKFFQWLIGLFKGLFSSSKKEVPTLKYKTKEVVDNPLLGVWKGPDNLTLQFRENNVLSGSTLLGMFDGKYKISGSKLDLVNIEYKGMQPLVYLDSIVGYHVSLNRLSLRSTDKTKNISFIKL